MIPEAAYAMLACARIGAVHSVVFGGFSPDSLAGRIEDCDSTSGHHRRRRPARRQASAAQGQCRRGAEARPGVEACSSCAHRRRGAMKAGRDVWYHERCREGPPTARRADERGGSAVHPLHLGLDRQAEGRAAHHRRLSVYASMTHQYVFDYHDGDVYWCTADVGWVTGHSYIVYGPLANGATTLMFEGVPNYPDASRFWEVIDKHKVNIFYTAPTAIRALMREGDEPVKKHLARKRCACSAGRRADQSGSLGMVLHAWSATALPDRRHLVADRDRRHPDHAAARRHRAEAGLGDAAVLRRAAAAGRCRRQGARRRDRGQPVHHRFLAGPDAHGLRRSPALRQTYFKTYPGQVLHRRRLPPRRGRLLLDHRPRRRRDQRLRPPHGHGRGRERAGRPCEGGRGRRGRLSRTTSRARASTPMSR
jgi:hypothetical protein